MFKMIKVTHLENRSCWLWEKENLLPAWGLQPTVNLYIVFFYIFSCPDRVCGQLNRWHCHWLTEPLLILEHMTLNVRKLPKRLSLTILKNVDNFLLFLQFWQILHFFTFLTFFDIFWQLLKKLTIFDIFNHFDIFWQFWKYVNFFDDYLTIFTFLPFWQFSSLSLSLYLSFFNFFGHVLSSNHSEQMSQRSQVSRMALRRCSQNVFVFVIVFVFVFVFVITIW